MLCFGALYFIEMKQMIIISPKFKISGILYYGFGLDADARQGLCFHVTATPMRAPNSYLTQPLMT